jgi:palmitoyl-protein thioesterase
LARYIAEECEMPGKVRNMATLGGPHMGVDAVPGCFEGVICDIVNKIAKKLVYLDVVQNWFAPAGYFRDVNNMAAYLKSSVFLPVLNNEASQTSKFAEVRKGKLTDLNSIMLAKFDKDTVIYPKETAWF